MNSDCVRCGGSGIDEPADSHLVEGATTKPIRSAEPTGDLFVPEHQPTPQNENTTPRSGRPVRREPRRGSHGPKGQPPRKNLRGSGGPSAQVCEYCNEPIVGDIERHMRLAHNLAPGQKRAARGSRVATRATKKQAPKASKVVRSLDDVLICPDCGKRLRRGGLEQHRSAKHSVPGNPKVPEKPTLKKKPAR